MTNVPIDVYLGQERLGQTLAIDLPRDAHFHASITDDLEHLVHAIDRGQLGLVWHEQKRLDLRFGVNLP